jgi:peroxiredoxin
MPLRIGEVVPDVTLADHTGAPWRLGEHRGHPVVLVLHRHLA